MTPLHFGDAEASVFAFQCASQSVCIIKLNKKACHVVFTSRFKADEEQTPSQSPAPCLAIVGPYQKTPLVLQAIWKMHTVDSS